mgnify:CR=1 FL=1
MLYCLAEKDEGENMGISSKLIRLCALNEQLDEAHHLFDQMPKHHESVFPWNSLIACYAEKGLHKDELALYFQMDEEGMKPDQNMFPHVLKTCRGIGLIQAWSTHDGYLHGSVYLGEIATTALFELELDN